MTGEARTRAEQAQNVEKRISALERLGGHGRLPDYWRKHLVFLLAADEVAASELIAELEAAEARCSTLTAALEWYAERRNYAPAGGESSYDAVTARDGFDGLGPGARARAALAGSTGEEPTQ